jgi:hypothetical protein
MPEIEKESVSVAAKGRINDELDILAGLLECAV